MSDHFVDTDVLIRLLTGDDPIKQAAAQRLFEQVEAGSIRLDAPDTVIADAVYVLSSPRLYRVARADVRDQLTRLVRMPGFQVLNRAIVLRALELFGSTNLGFGDAMIIAAMEQSGAQTVVSFDGHFDRVSGIVRRVP